MIPQWWSWGLALFGALGYVLVLKGKPSGIWIALSTQALWAGYALATGQHGFWVSVVLFTAANVFGLISRDRKPKQNPPTKRGREYCD